MQFAKPEKDRTKFEKLFLSKMTYKQMEINILSLADLEVLNKIGDLKGKSMTISGYN